MSQITNKKNLNEAILRAVQKEWYSGAGEKRDYSVTQLLNPTKVFHLMKRHKDELEEDVTDRIFMMMGSAMHAILERANENDSEFQILSRVRNFFEFMHENTGMSDNDALVKFADIVMDGNGHNDIPMVNLFKGLTQDRFLIEKRFKYTTKTGKIITGGIDLYDKETHTLHDYKFSSVWTWIYRNKPGSRVEDWTHQLNMYRLFMEQQGYPVDKLCINLIFRDYSKTKAKQDYDYPKEIETIELQLLGLDVVEKMIENKVAEIEQYSNTIDNSIPPCTSAERWQTHDTFAVRKHTNKTASKVEYSWTDAEKWRKAEAGKIAQKDIDKGMPEELAIQKAYDLFLIEKRAGSPGRCVDYCACNSFCHFYREWLRSQTAD